MGKFRREIFKSVFLVVDSSKWGLEIDRTRRTQNGSIDLRYNPIQPIYLVGPAKLAKPAWHKASGHFRGIADSRKML
ncbi:MAG: hypothetical protein JST65_13350 [Acidobacteria bacterium]|nr:hypothetical protein [Acidobacteriota bacterium]